MIDIFDIKLTIIQIHTNFFTRYSEQSQKEYTNDVKGKINLDKAIKKADSEYDKYAVIQDKSYISDFDKLVYETEQLK